MNAYDFDHTIYRGDASLDFIISTMLRHPLQLRYLPIQAWAAFLYVIGKRSRKEIKEVAFSFLKNLKDVDEDVARFWATHEKKIEAWYIEQNQVTDVIVSASPEFLLKPIASKLGVMTLIGTKMNAKSGKITGKNCRGEEKVVRLQKEGIESFEEAYSDSMSDLPLLRLAKTAYIVRKGTVTKLASTEI